MTVEYCVLVEKETACDGRERLSVGSIVIAPTCGIVCVELTGQEWMYEFERD